MGFDILGLTIGREFTDDICFHVSRFFLLQGGMITSPRKTGSLQYPDSTECIWEIRTEPGYHTEVKLPEISTRFPLNITLFFRSPLRAALIWSCQPPAQKTTLSCRAGRNQVRDGFQWMSLSVVEHCHSR